MGDRTYEALRTRTCRGRVLASFRATLGYSFDPAFLGVVALKPGAATRLPALIDASKRPPPVWMYMDPARLQQADWIRCNSHNC